MSDGPTPLAGAAGTEAAAASLSITANVHYLVVIRAFVEAAARVVGANAGLVDHTVQAVDESASNIILHGYRSGPGLIEVEVKLVGDDLTVVVSDMAPVFDPTSLREPDVTLPLDERPIGGLGVFLARKLVDEIHHRERPGGGNELTLIKRGRSGNVTAP
jgi:anti-sigma regulatory factor (Ser/Thr protein kinase)